MAARVVKNWLTGWLSITGLYGSPLNLFFVGLEWNMIYFGPFRWGLEDLKDPNCISAVLNSFLWKCVLICNIIWLKLFNLLANYTIRKPQRRSSRLNQGSREITEVSDKTLLENTEVSSAPSTLSVQKQHGPDKVSSYTLLVYRGWLKLGGSDLVRYFWIYFAGEVTAKWVQCSSEWSSNGFRIWGILMLQFDSACSYRC